MFPSAIGIGMFRFPHDLAQAEDVRCSLDALLLAAFVVKSGDIAVDIGAGCGVVGLGLLLRGVAATVIGLERDSRQAANARSNARDLGLQARYDIRQADIAGHLDFPAHTADVAVCNPPWRLLPAQRPPVSARRRAALYGTAQTLPLFARTAAHCLKPGGVFCAIAGADRLADLLDAMENAALHPGRLLAVHPRAGRRAVFVLVEARSATRCRLAIEPPLVLYAGPPPDAAYSGEALQFCPWLAPAGSANPPGSSRPVQAVRFNPAME
jgi:tRNA1Val (adenine37-N6)-methyltransferase